MVNALDLLTTAEAARLLKVSPVTLRRWIKQGRLPAYHVGPRKVRLRREDLARVLTPTNQQEVSYIQKRAPTTSSLFIKTLSDDEVAKGFAAMQEADAVIEAILARRKGMPLDSSAPLIRRERGKRSKQLL